MKRSTGNTLLASPEHFEAICSESKIATIRTGRRDFAPGKTFYFESNEENTPEGPIEVMCKRNLWTTAGELGPDEFAAAGLDQDPVQGLWQLRQVYPDLKPEDEVTVIYFERL